jgi:LppP/LprE lipoprotein
MTRRAAILLVTCALTLMSQTARNTSWLDTKIKPWNRAGGTIPKVKPAFDSDLKDLKNRCDASRQRPTDSPEVRAVGGRGWIVFKSQSDFHGIVIVSAQQDYDGMCRPLGYQDFVFVNGVFAGTLSPKAMNAREDGASVSQAFLGDGKISAEFVRYNEKDPLCCPSRISEVTYEIQTSGTKPLVVVTDIRTRPSN